MSGKLTPKQTIIAARVAAGNPKHIIAEEEGIHASTISVLMRDKYFQLAVTNFRDAMTCVTRDRVRALGTKAVSVLEDMMTSPKDTVRLKAACYILDALKVPAQPGITQLDGTQADDTPFIASGEELEAYRSDPKSEEYVVPDNPAAEFIDMVNKSYQ